LKEYAIPQIKNQQVGATRIERLKRRIFQRRHEIMEKHWIFTYGVNNDFIATNPQKDW